MDSVKAYEQNKIKIFNFRHQGARFSGKKPQKWPLDVAPRVRRDRETKIGKWVPVPARRFDMVRESVKSIFYYFEE